ncbi:hypothetical protein E2C01_097247 [Portunus trituberculatus]|uniref:Uncharacterized protein n=1 Tax=Portunus trituberculatus TaxID=210409 RepID=A0A5B7K584_PORTR|nr:hypothetical protein [Portunus trituberculatus]
MVLGYLSENYIFQVSRVTVLSHVSSPIGITQPGRCSDRVSSRPLFTLYSCDQVETFLPTFNMQTDRVRRFVLSTFFRERRKDTGKVSTKKNRLPEYRKF